MSRKQLQELFLRVCRDSGFSLEATQAASIAAKAAGVSPLEFWVAFGTIDAMDKVADGGHPSSKAQ